MRPKYLFKGLIFSVLFVAILICPRVSFAENQNINQLSVPVNSPERHTYLSYTVKPGETLSEILWVKFKLKHLYGADGWIQKSFLLNKGTIRKKGDLIIAGDEILLPFTDVSEALSSPWEEGVGEVHVDAKDEVAENGEAGQNISKNLTKEPENDKSVPKENNEQKRDVATEQKDSKENESQKNEFAPHSNFKADLSFNYIGLYGKEKSNGTTATLLSGLTPTLNLSWIQYWTPETFSSEHIFAQQVAIQPDQNGRALDGSSLFNTGFGVDVGSHLNEKLVLAIGLAADQEIFYVGTTNGNLKLNQVPIMKIRPSAEWTFVKIKPFSAALYGGASYYNSSNYDVYSIQSGFGYDAGLLVSQDFKKSTFDVKIHYSERQQNTSLLIFSEKTIGLSLGYSWGAE